MKRILLCAALLFPVLASAQALTTTGPGGLVPLGVIAGTGQIGPVITYTATNAAPTTHTIEYSVAGTPPGACMLQLEGSLDNVHWYSLTGALSCITGTMTHVVSRPVLYVRANVLTYTAGDGTTAISVRYLRGAQ